MRLYHPRALAGLCLLAATTLSPALGHAGCVVLEDAEKTTPAEQSQLDKPASPNKDTQKAAKAEQDQSEQKDRTAC